MVRKEVFGKSPAKSPGKSPGSRQEVTEKVNRGIASEAQGSPWQHIQASVAQATGTSLLIEVFDANVGVWGHALYLSELLLATLAFLTLPAYAGGFFDSCSHRLQLLHAH